MEDLLSVAKVAKKLGVSGEMVRRMAHDGSLPCVHLGRRILFSPAVLDAWLQDAIDGNVKFIGLVLRCSCGGGNEYVTKGQERKVVCGGCGTTLNLGSFFVAPLALTYLQHRTVDLMKQTEQLRREEGL